MIALIKSSHAKLLKFKKWLTIPEAAKYLSGACDSEVTDADILRLGLDRHLKLSINFVEERWAAPCQLVIYKNSELKAAIENNIYPEELNWRENQCGVELLSLHIGEDKYLNLDKKNWVSLSGLWDLPMIDGDWREIEQKWRNLTESPVIKCPNYYGTFLESETGGIYRLRDGINFSDYTVKYKSKETELRRHIADNNISKENAEVLLSQLEAEREAFFNKQHRAILPDDGVLVVRTEALREFEQSIADNQSKISTTSKPHGNAERFAQCREQILGAAVSVMAEWPEQCQNRLGKFQATKIVKLIDEKALLFWSVTGEPPLTLETMEREISKWINKTGK